MPVQHVQIHGHDVAYRQAGEGPVVLLVHGIAGSGATWRPVIPALSRHATVVAPDLPGHGQSAKPRGDYSLGAYASGLRDLMVRLGHERATIVGHSLGGGIAMQFAYQYPERCERLVLVGSGGLGAEVSRWLRVLTFPGAEYLMPLGLNPRIRDVATTVSGWIGRVGVRRSPLLEEFWRTYVGLTEAESRSAFVHTLRSVVDLQGQRVSAADRLYLASTVPTLLIWGERDAMIPVAHARATHEAIPGSRLEVFPDVGHYPHTERPERFADALADFIATTSPAELSDEEWRALLHSGATPV